jgi:hypothetical protein
MTKLVMLTSILAAVNPNQGNSIPPVLWFSILAVLIVVSAVVIIRRRKR